MLCLPNTSIHSPFCWHFLIVHRYAELSWAKLRAGSICSSSSLKTQHFQILCAVNKVEPASSRSTSHKSSHYICIQTRCFAFGYRCVASVDFRPGYLAECGMNSNLSCYLHIQLDLTMYLLYWSSVEICSATACCKLILEYLFSRPIDDLLRKGRLARLKQRCDVLVRGFKIQDTTLSIFDNSKTTQKVNLYCFISYVELSSYSTGRYWISRNS